MDTSRLILSTCQGVVFRRSFSMAKQTSAKNTEARAPATKEAIKVITVNRQAYHDYFVERTVEAGISLVGTEIKSIREGRVNLRGSFAIARNGELWLENAHIST